MDLLKDFHRFKPYYKYALSFMIRWELYPDLDVIPYFATIHMDRVEAELLFSYLEQTTIRLKHEIAAQELNDRNIIMRIASLSLDMTRRSLHASPCH